MQYNNNFNLLTNEEYKIYSRQLLIKDISIEGQLKLKKAKILFIGAGGLAASALLYLAGAGIGHIGIVDEDYIELSNLHRQIIYTTQDIGKYKAIAARKHLNNLNPKCNLKLYITRLHKHNACHIMKKYDIIIDSTDNFTTRDILSHNCYKLHKIHIYGAVSALEGRVSVFNYQGGPHYQNISQGSSTRELNSCLERGVLGVTTGLIGLIQATEAIKIITGIGKVLSGEMLMYDSLELSFKKIKIRNHNYYKKVKNGKTLLQTSNNVLQKGYCLSLPEFQKFKVQYKDLVYLIDLRDPFEYKIKHLKGAINIPIDKLKNSSNLILLKSISMYKYIFIYCNSYSRSKIGSTLLEQAKVFHWVLKIDRVI